jgi:hypothetical protein
MRITILVALFMAKLFGQVVITDSGSTNRPGMTVTLDGKRNAEIANRAGTKMQMHLQPELQKRFMQDMEAAGPLDQLPARHCAKSVSFGSSMFVTSNGVRSPDISCGGQTDPKVIALQKDAQEIIALARTKMPQPNRLQLQ